MHRLMAPGQEQAAGCRHEDTLVTGQVVALLLDLLHQAAFQVGAIL
jgi:hypothetical protein